MPNNTNGGGNSNESLPDRETFLREFRKLGPFVSHQKGTIVRIDKEVSAFKWQLHQQYERRKAFFWFLWAVLLLMVNGIAISANLDSPERVGVDGSQEHVADSGLSGGDSVAQRVIPDDSTAVRIVSAPDTSQREEDSSSSAADITSLTEADESEDTGDRLLIMFLGGNFLVALAALGVKGKLQTERGRIRLRAARQEVVLRERKGVSAYDGFREIYDATNGFGEYLRTGAPEPRNDSWNALGQYCESNELVDMSPGGHQGSYRSIVEIANKHDWCELDENTVNTLTAFNDLWVKAGLPANAYWQTDRDTLRDVHLALVCLSLYEYAKVEYVGDVMPEVEFSLPREVVTAASLTCFTQTINGISTDKLQRISDLKRGLAGPLRHSRDVVESLLMLTNRMIDHDDVALRLVAWLPICFFGILVLLIIPIVLFARMAFTEIALVGILAVSGPLAWGLSRTRRRIPLPGKATQSKETQVLR